MVARRSSFPRQPSATTGLAGGLKRFEKKTRRAIAPRRSATPEEDDKASNNSRAETIAVIRSGGMRGRRAGPKNLCNHHRDAVSRRGDLHLLRIIFGWQVEIGGLSIPFWVSWPGVLVTGALAYFGFTQP